MADELERVSMDEVDAEDAVPLPNKEVMSLLDVNANVDLGLDLAAPVDLAAAPNLNVAAPFQAARSPTLLTPTATPTVAARIKAAASANLLSSDAQAVALSQQHGTIDQGISGSADATAPQHAEITQDANSDDPTGTPGAVSETPAAAAIPPAGDDTG